MTNIKHVATLAGVSASTVSRVLNGKSYVNETTRQKVMEAVQKTNYRQCTGQKPENGPQQYDMPHGAFNTEPDFSGDRPGRGGCGAP